jgi:hypothetical protein
LGVNNVTLTVTDVNTNSSTCAATVTVTNDPLVATTASPTVACGYNVTCNGATNGTADVCLTPICGATVRRPPRPMVWVRAPTR